jgi:hypothetical protein
MLGSSNTQSHVKNSKSLDVKPRVFLEINNNDYGNPYFYGTGTQNSSILQELIRTVSNYPASPAPINAGSILGSGGRGVKTAISGIDNHAVLLKTNLSAGEPIEYSWYTESSANQRSVKFNLFLKSDYEYQIETNDLTCMESFDVLLVAVGYDSSNKIVTSETVAESVTVDSIQWKNVSIAFANPDQYATVNKVRLNIYVTAPAYKKVALLVGQPVVSNISDYEVYSSNRMPLSEVFEPGRPGEFLIDISGSLEETPPIKPTIRGITQQPTPIHMATYYALGPKYELVQRSVTPYPNNPYTYYVSGTSTESKQVWALYQNKIKTNKIVLKFNAIACKPQTPAVNILTSSGWSNNIASSASIGSDGTLVLYFNGTSWGTSKWTSISYPTISTSSINAGDIVLGSNSGYQEIWGIRVEGVAQQVTNTDFIDLPGRMELIEVSPRLDIDVSNFVTSVSTISESSSDALLNIGGISSNSYNINLSNIPLIKNLHDFSTGNFSNPDVRPISNISSTSALQNLIRKGVKVKGGYDIDTGYRGTGIATGKTYIQSFVGYVDTWKENNQEIVINAFDVIKNLQSVNSESIYLEGKKISECIYSVLDPIGFGEVYGEELVDLRVFANTSDSELTFSQNEKIKFFWTSNDKTVSDTLNNLFRIYQISMYTDEYGAVRFKTLYDYSMSYKNLTKTSSPSYPDIFIQDINDNNSTSNLISVDITENERPKSILVKYRIPRPTLAQPTPPKTKKDNKPVAENINIKISESTDRVWILQDDSYIVPYIQLSGGGIKTTSQNFIPYDISMTNIFMRAIPFSSMLLIDKEIVSYDGIEYEFSYKTSTGFSVLLNQTVKSSEEIEMIKSEIFSNKGGRSISFKPTGKLMNVKRGLFGTTPTPHNRQTSSTNAPWLMKRFTRTENSYKNAVSSQKFTTTLNGINVTSNNNSEMLLLYPKDSDSDAYLMRDKRRLLCQFKLGDIPDKKEGYVGVGVGLEINSSNNLVGGLLVWVGVETDKKKTNPTVYVEQIKSNGTIETLVEKDQFKYSDRVIEENENMEIYISLNENRDECKVLIGGSTAFEKIISKKIDGKKKEIKQHTFKIRQLSGRTTFGFIANRYGTATMGQYLFGVSDKFEDMNSINLSLVDSKYSLKNSLPTKTFFIGSNNLLDTIVDGRNVTGINLLSKDNFTYTGAPVARGIQVFDVEYEKFPVIRTPIAEWTGYTYDSNAFEGGNLISEEPR